MREGEGGGGMRDSAFWKGSTLAELEVKWKLGYNQEDAGWWNEPIRAGGL